MSNVIDFLEYKIKKEQQSSAKAKKPKFGPSSWKRRKKSGPKQNQCVINLAPDNEESK